MTLRLRPVVQGTSHFYIGPHTPEEAGGIKTMDLRKGWQSEPGKNGLKKELLCERFCSKLGRVVKAV